MDNVKISKELLKIAKELLAVRVDMVFDFSYQKKVFAEFKKQHPRLNCEFYQNGVQSYWKISDDKKTSTINFDYFEKSDSYHGVFVIGSKEYDSLYGALNSLKFGIDFRDDNWVQKLDKDDKQKVTNYLIKTRGENFIFYFSGKPVKLKDMIQEYIIDQIQQSYQESLRVFEYNIGYGWVADDQDKKILKEISQNKNVFKNAQTFLKKYGDPKLKLDLNGLILSMFTEEFNFSTWGNYNKKDWLPGGEHYDDITYYLEDYDFSLLSEKEKKQINKILGY